MEEKAEKVWTCRRVLQTSKREKESKHGPLIRAVTEQIVDIYSNCSGEYSYSTKLNPKRTLTWPCQGVHNGGLDNADHNFICHVGEKITNSENNCVYELIENLGQGSFGQVLKCSTEGSPNVAMKIAKNKPAYFTQGCIEAKHLKWLNTAYDPEAHHIVKMLDCFVFKKHLCIVFELLSMNLFEFLKWNNYKGATMAIIQIVTRQLLKALHCMRAACLIHCDLKPENVMVVSLEPMRVKLIDFGSACSDDMKAHSYIQSRFYRSPEILLGVPYSSAIDLWSLGCICAELHLGLPVWPGQCEYDQLRLITKLLGLPPTEMLAMGNKSKRYFKREATQSCDALEAVAAQSKQLQELTSAGSSEPNTGGFPATLDGFGALHGGAGGYDQHPSEHREEYEQEANKKLTMSKRSWKFTCLEELVKDVPEEMRSCFLEFVSGLFQMDPKKRWSAKQALLHPFVKDDVPLEDPVACTSGMCQPIDANAPSSTTGTPASSPHGSACSTAFSQARQQAMLRSPWHLNSPGSGSENASPPKPPATSGAPGASAKAPDAAQRGPTPTPTVGRMRRRCGVESPPCGR
ncbi:unnamed protein product [Effrenium voratum]|nr:unnamed protein product [Effrenium voratum]